MVAKTPSNEIRITRIYDAPVRMVWDAWTDPNHAAKWWGPRGFTITTHDKDFRPGGHWKYTMHGPDGTDYPNNTVYLEVEEFKKLVYDHGGNDDQPPLFRVTVLFTEVDGKTLMEMSMMSPTPEAADEIRKIIKVAGGNSTWDRLAEYLEKHKSGKDEFVIARNFEAPRERIFELWTDPLHFVRWLPPTGCTMQFLRADIRQGGSTLWRMTNDSGLTMYGRAEYLQIEKPTRIVYTQQFCDEHERISRHPKMPTWPATMLTTVTLAEDGPERTIVTVTWEPFGPTTPEELACFLEARGGMSQGWTGSFDKLDELISQP